MTPRTLILLASLVFVLLITGCGIIGDDEADPPVDDGTVANLGPIIVLDSAMATAIDDQTRATGVVDNVFPPEVRQIYIVLVLDGVDVGTVITGRWFQLVDDGPPGGTEISTAGITLTETNVIEGATRVELNLSSGPEGFPADDYLVRVYAGDEFIKTSAFVVSPLVVHPTGGGGATAPEPTPAGGQSQPEPSATPGTAAPEPTATTPPPDPTATQTSAPPAPTATQPQGSPETYTVVSGDTLTIIAERFKPATEPTESYVARLQQENNLQPGAILFVGQVLTLPQ
jgi:hypothetical protein